MSDQMFVEVGFKEGIKRQNELQQVMHLNENYQREIIQ